jgi:hypothetical protein
MTDSSDNAATDEPTKLREEVEQELQELTDEASSEEAQRMSERERAGVDEPNEESGE